MHLHRRAIGWFREPDVEVFAFAGFEKHDVVAVVQVGEFVELGELGFGVEFGVFAAVGEERVEIAEEMAVSMCETGRLGKRIVRYLLAVHTEMSRLLSSISAASAYFGAGFLHLRLDVTHLAFALILICILTPCYQLVHLSMLLSDCCKCSSKCRKSSFTCFGSLANQNLESVRDLFHPVVKGKEHARGKAPEELKQIANKGGLQDEVESKSKVTIRKTQRQNLM